MPQNRRINLTTARDSFSNRSRIDEPVRIDREKCEAGEPAASHRDLSQYSVCFDAPLQFPFPRVFLPSFLSSFLSFLRVDSVTVRTTFARNCDRIDFLEEESERAAARSRPHPPFALPFLLVCTTTLHRCSRSTRPRPHGGAISSHSRSIFSVLPSLDGSGRRCLGATALLYIDAYVDKLRPTFILSPRVKRSCSLFSRRSHSHL